MALCVLATHTMTCSLVNMLLFKPPPMEPYCFPGEVIRLTNAKGNVVCATFIALPGSAITLLVSHGNAEDLNNVYRYMMKLSKCLDVNVIGYDYSGYGESTGNPSERNCYADIDCVFEYLTRSRNIPPEHIVLYGRSLGSGPSCYLAAKSASSGRSVAGLILHAPFTSVYRVVNVDFFGYTVLGDQFPNIDRIAKVECPVFVAHGQEDEIVPFEHGVALVKASPYQDKTEFFFTKGMHHNYYESPEIEWDFLDALNAYLDYHILARRLWMRPNRKVRVVDL